MKKIALWEAKHPKTVLLFALLLLIPALIGFACTGVNYDILSYLPDALESMQGEQVLDETYAPFLNNSVERTFAPIANGLGTVMNTVVPSGMYNEWHTQILFSAVPALVEFTKHVIVDTSKTTE